MKNMKNKIKNSFSEIIIIFIIIAVILDYKNLPSTYGFEMTNINWSFFTVTINILLYIITYKAINKRIIERDKNKSEVSLMLLKECYNECIDYIRFLNKETVENYIVPKIDINSARNIISDNLQNSPFSNENTIMDLIKDGQLTKMQIEGYFKVREKYRQYIIMRITFFNEKNMYEPLKMDLLNIIDIEIKKLDKKLLS